jgi:hypothetical protein
MPLSELKIMVVTNDPTQRDVFPLTWRTLNYTGSNSIGLNNYPFFDPDVKLTQRLQTRINRMTYNEKIELFFNKEKFDRTIVHNRNNTTQKKTTIAVDSFLNKLPYDVRRKFKNTFSFEDKEIIEKTFQDVGFMVENNDTIQNKYTHLLNAHEDSTKSDDTNLTAKEKDLVNSLLENLKKLPFTTRQTHNFEFILQTLLCTGFTGSNYFRTMEFYDPNIRSKMNIIAPSNGGGIMSYLFQNGHGKCFSYIKKASSIYTITGVRWINDVLNHPIYKEIIDAYKKHYNEQKTNDKHKEQEELQTQLEMYLDLMYLNIYHHPDIWTESINRDNVQMYGNSSESTREEQLILRNELQDIVKMINGPPSVPLFITTGVTDKLKSITNDTTGYQPLFRLYSQAPESEKNFVLQEWLVSNKSSLEKNDNDPSDVNTIFKSVFENRESTQIEIQEKLKRIIKSRKDNILLLPSRLRYSEKFVNYSKNIKKILYQKEVYEIMKNNLDYQHRPADEIAIIQKIMKDEYPNYNIYSNSFITLAKTRKISNIHLRRESERFISSPTKVLKKGNDIQINATANIGVLDTLMKCEEKNVSCTLSNNVNAVQYLNLGLDELKTDTRDNKNKTASNVSRVYEAYVQLDIVKGEITNKNASKIRCAYDGNVLGDITKRMYDRESSEKDNYILEEAIYIDLTSEIETANQLLKQKEKTPRTKKKKRGVQNTQTKKKTVQINKKVKK